MGHDYQAVVDDNLKVHGLEHLTIADASIMPVTVSGNSNSTTMAIAEKAADRSLTELAANPL
jgi:choline dehydrogenase